jgi:hypothetical protein
MRSSRRRWQTNRKFPDCFLFVKETSLREGYHNVNSELWNTNSGLNSNALCRAIPLFFPPVRDRRFSKYQLWVEIFCFLPSYPLGFRNANSEHCYNTNSGLKYSTLYISCYPMSCQRQWSMDETQSWFASRSSSQERDGSTRWGGQRVQRVKCIQIPKFTSWETKTPCVRILYSRWNLG